MNPPKLLCGFLFLLLGLIAVFSVYSARSAPISYEVSRGDTLFSLATRYYGDGHLFERIAEANGLSQPYLLAPGMQITIPCAVQGSGLAMALAMAVLFVLVSFGTDVPAFNFADRVLGNAGDSSRTLSAASVASVFTAGSVLWLIAVWGATGKTGVIVALPLVLFLASLLRIHALAPVYEGDTRRAALTWGVARVMSGTAILLVLLIVTAVAGEHLNPFFTALSLMAPMGAR